MRRLVTIILTLLLALPIIILLGIQLLQYCDIRFRHAVSVPLHIQDTKGIAQVGVRLRFRESGMRYLVPIPFTWSWESKGIIHDVESDSFGAAAVAFRDHTLYLEDISAQGRAITNFVTVFHRYDGLSFTNRGHLGFFLHHGYYPPAKDPWRQDHTIIIQ
jgi:membrane-associated protease RseP (regulator of RpoE activity)